MADPVIVPDSELAQCRVPVSMCMRARRTYHTPDSRDLLGPAAAAATTAAAAAASGPRAGAAGGSGTAGTAASPGCGPSGGVENGGSGVDLLAASSGGGSAVKPSPRSGARASFRSVFQAYRSSQL